MRREACDHASSASPSKRRSAPSACSRARRRRLACATPTRTMPTPFPRESGCSAEFNCAGCHANGGGGMGPPLMDAAWIYGGEPDSVYATIVQGRPNGMPAFGKRAQPRQAWQLAAYVRSMSGLLAKDVAPGRDDHMQDGARSSPPRRRGRGCPAPASHRNPAAASDAPAPGAHSALDPAGPQAAHDRRAVVIPCIYTALAVFVVVAGGLLPGRVPPHLVPRESRRRQFRRDATCSASPPPASRLSRCLCSWCSMSPPAASSTTASRHRPLAIQVTGHQWWWEVQYPDSIPQRRVTTANEIHIPVGAPVVVELRSHDVIHSFWVPNLQRQAGHDSRAKQQRLVPGGHAPACTADHAPSSAASSTRRWRFLVVAEPADSFTAWLAAQRQTAAAHAGRQSASAGGRCFWLAPA